MEKLEILARRETAQSRRMFLVASVASLTAAFVESGCAGHQETNKVEKDANGEWVEENATPSRIREYPEDSDLHRNHWPAARADLESQRLTPENGRVNFSNYHGPKDEKRVWGSFSVEKRYNGDVEVIIAIKITHDTFSFTGGKQHYCFDGGTIDFKIVDGNGLEIRAQTSENGTGWVVIPKDKGTVSPYRIRFPRNPKGE